MNTAPIRTKEALVSAMAAGYKPDFLHFWGHRPAAGRITASCLSQWYAQSFLDGHELMPTAEHYMMVRKADLFGDAEARRKVMSNPDPGAAKSAGRSVRGYVDARWNEIRFEAVVQGNLLKFGQNKPLLHYLLSTGDKILVEASPPDAIWGIGLGASHPDAVNPPRWPGLNLLGFALMEVRSRLGA